MLIRPEAEKWCTNCKARHDPAAFGLDRSRGDGLRTACRASRHVPAKTGSERFFARTQRADTGCLLWTGSTYPCGYGAFWFEGRVVGAHRVAWILAEGSIPGGAYVLHSCDVRPCVERRHLFLGDHLANMKDMDQKGRRARLTMEKHPRAKLTEAQVVEIRSLAGSISQRMLGVRYGVSKTLIRKIILGQLWADSLAAVRATEHAANDCPVARSPGRRAPAGRVS